MDSIADGPQVQVKFVTQQRQFAIPETAIQTPARLRRYGLSQIINLVLQNEGGTSILLASATRTKRGLRSPPNMICIHSINNEAKRN